MKYSWFVPTRITAPFTGAAPSYYPPGAPPFDWSSSRGGSVRVYSAGKGEGNSLQRQEASTKRREDCAGARTGRSRSKPNKAGKGVWDKPRNAIPIHKKLADLATNRTSQGCNETQCSYCLFHASMISAFSKPSSTKI